MNTETITERRGWLKNFSKRTLVIGGMVGALILVTAAISIAAIFLRAELSGQAVSGAEVAFEWSDPAGDPDATFVTYYAVDSNGDGSFDSTTAVPLPLTCTASAVAGELQVDMSGGWLPSETCVVTGGLRLSNPSSVDIDVIDWVYGTADIGGQGDGAPVELWVAATVADGSTDVGLPAAVDAGQLVEPGLLYFQIATDAPFSSTFDFDGTAVVGYTTR